eukprot:CAMPEP_0119271008 /NCGR_PEP_ID=MMETSP1329-20130426/7775_1 /TAXON_ID=114041 /ORGANISM="Genus nov. species nov., Strain RCC1024" /LENGTH=431 /DNA_ID=CAMNT_0007271045 /DNA_START=203 /DNA_END=1495 /DNA_ORIENTATION=-
MAATLTRRRSHTWSPSGPPPPPLRAKEADAANLGPEPTTTKFTTSLKRATGVAICLYGAVRLVVVLSATAWFYPLVVMLVGLRIVVKASVARVREMGGPIALLPPSWRHFIQTTSPLEAASYLATFVDFQHWIGVFIHSVQLLRIDAAERDEILRELPPRVRAWATRPGLLRTCGPVHDALVWGGEEAPREAAVPVFEEGEFPGRRRAPTPIDYGDLAVAAAKINPWKTLIHILARRAYRSLRAHWPERHLAQKAGVAGALLGAQLLASPRMRAVARREALRTAYYGLTLALAVPAAGLWFLHSWDGPDGYNDDDDHGSHGWRQDREATRLKRLARLRKLRREAPRGEGGNALETAAERLARLRREAFSPVRRAVEGAHRAADDFYEAHHGEVEAARCLGGLAWPALLGGASLVGFVWAASRRGASGGALR